MFFNDILILLYLRSPVKKQPRNGSIFTKSKVPLLYGNLSSNRLLITNKPMTGVGFLSNKRLVIIKINISKDPNEPKVVRGIKNRKSIEIIIEP